MFSGRKDRVAIDGGGVDRATEIRLPFSPARSEEVRGELEAS